MEIERKFLIDGFPNLPMLSRGMVEQGYLSTRPVVRIRKTEREEGTSYMLCVKGEGSIARTEVELPLSAEQYRELQSLLSRPMIQKDYRVYALPGGLRLECSLVDGESPHGFFYAEVEFETMEQALSFQPPDFLGREVTEENYSMNLYWERGCLPETTR